ncbi:MAG: hypothetical protein C0490_20765 [Marivirga sp.]|nr:hypothetical protein [Marivirga sp.]
MLITKTCFSFIWIKDIHGPITEDPEMTGIVLFNTTESTMIRKEMEKDPYISHQVLDYKIIQVVWNSWSKPLAGSRCKKVRYSKLIRVFVLSGLSKRLGILSKTNE